MSRKAYVCIVGETKGIITDLVPATFTEEPNGTLKLDSVTFDIIRSDYVEKAVIWWPSAKGLPRIPVVVSLGQWRGAYLTKHNAITLADTKVRIDVGGVSWRSPKA